MTDRTQALTSFPVPFPLAELASTLWKHFSAMRTTEHYPWTHPRIRDCFQAREEARIHTQEGRFLQAGGKRESWKSLKVIAKVTSRFSSRLGGQGSSWFSQTPETWTLDLLRAPGCVQRRSAGEERADLFSVSLTAPGSLPKERKTHSRPEDFDELWTVVERDNGKEHELRVGNGNFSSLLDEILLEFPLTWRS